MYWQGTPLLGLSLYICIIVVYDHHVAIQVTAHEQCYTIIIVTQHAHVRAPNQTSEEMRMQLAPRNTSAILRRASLCTGPPDAGCGFGLCLGMDHLHLRTSFLCALRRCRD